MFDAKENNDAREVLDLAKEITRIIGAHGPRRLEVNDWRESAGNERWEFEFKIDGAAHTIYVPDDYVRRFSGDYLVRAQVTECIVSQIGKCLDGE